MVNGRMKQIVSKIMIGMFATAACFSLLSNLPAVSVPVNADSDVTINEENFPDINFRSYVSANCDVDKNGILSPAEIAGTAAIYVYSSEISSLKGIEYFSALKDLRCYNNQLASLDVSKNTELKILVCDNNKLTSLDVSKCTELEALVCYGNQLTSLDVSECTELKEIYCFKNRLTSLNVSSHTALKVLHCDSNQLTSLNVRKCTALEELHCYHNKLTSLNISDNTALAYLECYDNQLSEINIANNSKLSDAYAAGENTESRWEELPSSASFYRITNYSVFTIDRSVEILTVFPYEPGWNDIDGSWYYVLGNKTSATGWQKIGGSWYFFDEEGVMQTGWLEDGGSWYYLRSSGVMATGWEEVSGVWYYFGTNGKMATGWQKIGGVDYYLKSNGAMASDEYIDGYYLSKSGAWTYKYRASWKTDSKGTYYQDTDGWYPKNQWLRIDDQWYFFTPDGYKATAEYWNGYWFNVDGTWTYTARASWKKDSKGWYYQDTSDWYPSDCDVRIDGKLYNFDAAGYCTNP